MILYKITFIVSVMSVICIGVILPIGPMILYKMMFVCVYNVTVIFIGLILHIGPMILYINFNYTLSNGIAHQA
jgi:hypothetical protein